MKLTIAGIAWVCVALGVAPAAAKEQVAPDFTLPAASGAKHTLSDFKGKWVVLEWVNYDCPFVKKHYDASHTRMQTLQATYTGKDVVWLSICSSAPGKQGHMDARQGLERKRALGAKPTALLLDPEGKVGRLYRAKTTPDMRVIDPNGVVVYAGAIDSVRSRSAADVAGATNYVQEVLDAGLAGKPLPHSSQAPYGCSVKYAPKKQDAVGGGTTGDAKLAVNFALPGVDGRTHDLASYRGKWVILEWVNYDCPFVKKHYHRSHENMQKLQATYTRKGVAWLSICSSSPGKQGHMTKEQGGNRLVALGAAPTALLLDPTGRVGRAYGARTTPEIRVIDPKGYIVYAGGIDDVRSRNPRDVSSAKNFVQVVMDAVLAGKPAPVSKAQTYGCSVKYGK